MISGGRLKRLLDRDLTATRIEGLPVRYVAIATELGSGHEIWLTEGALVEAMRAPMHCPACSIPSGWAGAG